MGNTLTPKQQRFADEYLIDLNAAQAAIRAGYSTNSAKEIGFENLTKPHIREYVDTKLAERSRRTHITQDRVLQELARIAFVDVTDLVDPQTGEISDFASKDDRAAVQGIKVKRSSSDTGYSVEREVKIADKARALDMLGKHLGMFTEKHQHEITKGEVTVIWDGLDNKEPEESTENED